MKRKISLILVLVFLFPCFVIPTLAEEPTSHVTESSGDGYALYNGVKLSNIDTVWTDKTTYPYGYIMQTDASNIYPTLSGTVSAFNMTSIPAHVSDDGDVVVESGIAFQYQAWYYANSQEIIDWFISIGMSSAVVGEWFLVEDVSDMDGSLSVSPVLWTSADILNADGTVYFAASSPIPLDGMTVIEWDGVTDGLQNEGIYYGVADYRDVSYGYAVGNFNNLLVFANLFSSDENGWYVRYMSDENPVALGMKSYGMIGFCKMVDVDPQLDVYTQLLAYTPAGSEPDVPTDPTDPVPDLEVPTVSWSFADRELIVSEYHPIVAITNIGADGQCVLYSRSLNSDGTTSEWTPYMTDEVMKGDSGIDMCAFDLYPDESKIPYSMQYKAIVTLGSGTNTATAETDVLTIHWVKSSTVDPTEPTIDGGGSSGDVDSDDDVPMLQAIWQAITDGFNNVGVWFSTLFKLLQDGASVSDIQEVLGSIGDLQEDVDQLPNDITTGMENVLEQEQVKAEGQGNDSANQIVQIIPDPSADFIGSLQTLTTVLNYEGTACVLTMPAITIPSVGGLFREFTLLDEQQIDFEYWVNMMPPELIIIVRALFDIAIVGYCIKEFLDLVGGAVNGFGEGFANQIAGE